ncbi:hypothetical protein AGABI2DRAFT_181818 [Agaricus bisporus var. bisporus H97]|uniref:hypothetical protein n=1 Tax=Agaricus bisporus var. bisporus (strain H97 / ATCC MYA-4626 / FGSC 10389) TaxID=936046 RepID=UPI00029F75A9|nr:hypothetical protein AGABI2DRAFT_181818 [Agaricus bisporus var. bisporus H97]EKV50783.1 hypothetical protein AGABI2DRAFT_181818 [Agaricus bisporus var. bisporus H97]
MLLTRFPVFTLAVLSLFPYASWGNSDHEKAVAACAVLKQQIPHAVHFPGTSEYLQDIGHYVEVAGQNSTCGVAPMTPEEVQMIVKVLGRDDIRSPFAVKSGGHVFNPGFSSTFGVQVSLQNLLDFDYNEDAQTVKLGSGWTWDAIYEMLQPKNVTVVGGRIPGVGLGLLYGGGLSWYTNQHGLASDNVVEFDLVLPNGTFVNVTETSQPDLYFGLRGGLNNFGIITSVTVKTWPTGDIWGGTIAYSIEHNDEIMKAVEEFSVENTDVKAQLQAVYTLTKEKAFWQIIFFYDAPDSSPAPFKAFLSIPSTSDTTEVTTHSQFVKNTPFPPVVGSYLHTVPVLQYTVPVLQAVETSVNASFAKALKDERSAATFYWFAEPFYNQNSHSTFPSAFPHSPSNPITPSCFWYNYTSPDDVEYFRQSIKDVGTELQTVVVEEGQGRWDDVKYSNYAVKGTTVEEVFGESLDKMRDLKKRIDPKNVMGLQKEGFLI